MSNIEIVDLIFFGAIGIIAFLLMREFFCWYNKVNERLKEAKKTNSLLAELIKKLSNE